MTESVVTDPQSSTGGQNAESSWPRRSVPMLLRLLVLAATGVLMALAFPPFGWWPLAPLGVAGLTVVVAGRKKWAGFGYGFFFGLVFFGVHIRWLSLLGDEVWFGLVAYLALYMGAIGLGTAIVTRLPKWPVWVVFLWVGVEVLWSWLPDSIPWGRLAFSQADSPIVAFAWLGGAPALTAIVAGVGTMAASLWLAWRSGRDWARQFVFCSLAVAVLLTLGAFFPLPSQGQDEQGPASSVIAIVQGDVPQIGVGDGTDRKEVMDNVIAQTSELAEQIAAGEQPQPDAVIWPEDVAMTDPYQSVSTSERITLSAQEVAAPILVGAAITNPKDPDTRLNAGIVWDPVTGPGEIYAKQHLVPVGEYLPMGIRGWLGWLLDGYAGLPVRDVVPGDTSGVMQLGPVRLGDVICFEIAFDDRVRETVRAGARLIVEQTNNATYTGTGEPEQQLAMAKIRAVEHSRTVAVAATNGISAVFLPDGTQIAEIGESTAANVVAEVPLRDSLSPSDVLNRLLEWLAIVGLVVGVVLGLRRPDRTH